MSASGTKRTWRDVRLMSAFGGKADIVLRFMLQRAVDGGLVELLRPNMIRQALEESIARRYHESHIWPAFLGQFCVNPG